MASDGQEPHHTRDGRWIVVKGRRWRATDPNIPENLRAELVSELIRARRAVKSDGDTARAMVQDAKVALGERGEPWWQEPSEAGRKERLAATMRALLRHRDGSTMCPSDAARVCGREQWRDLMPLARDVALDLRGQDVLEVHQGGRAVTSELPRGPIRLAAGANLT